MELSLRDATPIKGPVVNFWCFFRWKHRKNLTTSKRFTNVRKETYTTILPKPLTCVSNSESKFV